MVLKSRNQPPYLKSKQDRGEELTEASYRPERRSAESFEDGLEEQQEADVAGGSVIQRISSIGRQLDRRNDWMPTTPPALNLPLEPVHTELPPPVVPSWRLKDRMKTVGIGMILALNPGTDPPDITKPHPCATLQCWMDPSSVSRSKAKEMIAERLESQYAQWQQQRTAKPLRYKRALDPTVEDVRALCLSLRRQARNERVLLHYNGHGVPRPTTNGEIWVFDKNHTQYIPLAVTDLRMWLGKPSIVVLDCSNAGVLMPYLTAPLDVPASRTPNIEPTDTENPLHSWINDTIVLCPTSDGEWLPLHPNYPADIFTSCLTTPIAIALRWFVARNLFSMGDLVDPDTLVDRIPGKANDRKTPLGELNWVFTAVTDSIAWNVLPTHLFQRLFRQDLLVASMFRNFLLADRILRSFGCSPVSHPPLPPDVSDHPLWQAWDLACESCISTLMDQGIIPRSSHSVEVAPSGLDSSNISVPFFAEQLSAFEIWLEFAMVQKQTNSLTIDSETPEQLPIVLQVLLSQVHRIRALMLLRKFLDLGNWAINLALSLGIFPYVLKLLQSPEYKNHLIGIWAKILAFDHSCQTDLLKDGALSHFTKHLSHGLGKRFSQKEIVENATQRIMATYVTAAILHQHPAAQNECIKQNLHRTCCALLVEQGSAHDGSNEYYDDDDEMRVLDGWFRSWLCICLANLMQQNKAIQGKVFEGTVQETLFSSLEDSDRDVRAAACFALGCFLDSSNPEEKTSKKVDPRQGGLLMPQVLQPTSLNALQLRGTPQPGFGSPGPYQVQPGAPLHIGRQLSPGTPMSVIPPADGSRGDTPRRIILAPFEAIQAQAQPQYTLRPPIPQEQLSQQSITFGSTVRRNEDFWDCFEDEWRVAIDLQVSEALLEKLPDGSTIVRYEAFVSLARLVEKYLPAFSVTSSTIATAPKGSSRGRHPNALIDAGVDESIVKRFTNIYWRLVEAPRKELHPTVADVAKSIANAISPPADTPRVQPAARSPTSTQPGIGSLQKASFGIDKEGLPESTFYEWKRDSFHEQMEDEFLFRDKPFDPLCVAMAKQADRKRRNLAVIEESSTMGEEYSASLSNLAALSGATSQRILTSDASASVVEEVSLGRKRPLGMKQKRVLRNKSAKTTTHLDFHPYEEIIAVCDGGDGITFFDIETGKTTSKVSNGNPAGTRFTSSCWLETDTQSLFVAGCDDGSVRVWADLFEDDREAVPSLQSSFFAVPDLQSDALGSGLVLSWQQHRGQIIASGNANALHCWDIQAEKKTGAIETMCDACITSMNTPWSEQYLTSQPSEAYLDGLGPNVVVTGFANGTVKLFDLRQLDPVMEIGANSRRRRTHPEHREHNNWIVTVASTNYVDRLEIVSGSVNGDMKIWDLRSSRSLRSYTVQQSPMTAFAVHPKIPVVASGSHAQFIKLMSLGGEPLQVIRFHEDRAGERIGPVGYLSMHRNRALLAAGGTDNFISVYARKEMKS